MNKEAFAMYLFFLWLLLLPLIDIVPEGTVANTVICVVEIGLSLGWLVVALVKCFKAIFVDSSLSDLWWGFVNWLVESIAILILVTVVFGFFCVFCLSCHDLSKM